MRDFAEIMKGFPKPSKKPIKSHTKETFQAEGWQFYVYNAVHNPNPGHRRDLLGIVIRYLMAGASLPEPVQECLVFVLGTMQKDGEAVPHLAQTTGRPVRYGADSVLSSRLYTHLAQNDEKKRRKVTIPEALQRFATKHHKSYSTIKRFYYGKKFEGYRQLLRAFRGGQK